MKTELANLSFASKKDSFLGCPETEFYSPEKSKAIIVPFGLEKTVSYGKGTKNGPMAIINASQNLELFDEEFNKEAIYEFGISTLNEVKIPNNLNEALKKLSVIIDDIIQIDKFPLVLGGEHSLTPAIINSLSKKFNPITILHFDAHADLRDQYENEPNSHACAMRRCLDYEDINIVSIGVRSMSKDEYIYAERNSQKIKIFYAKEQNIWNPENILAAIKTNNVYISFDIDGLDPSIIPATGTPEPGGLDWYKILKIINLIGKSKKIIGADLVELAPMKNFPSYDYTAAKLAYKILNYALIK